MRYLPLVVLMIVVLALAGCGGGGGTNHNAGEMGAASGRVSVPNAAQYRLIVDGQELEARPDAEGNFTLPNLPAGDHSLTVVGGGGFSGAHLGFTVEPGDTVDIGDITPRLGGQIAGIVSKQDEQGNLSVLPGVEVIADAEPIYYIAGTVPSEIPTREAEAIQFRAITDSNGSYLIPAVPEGAYVVTVNVPGLVQGVSWVWVSPASTAAADFQLIEAIDPGVGTVTGTIYGLGVDGSSGPLEGATVSITSDGTWTPERPTTPIPLPVEALSKALVPKQATGCLPPQYLWNEFTTLTDAAGRYLLNVPSGHLQLSVWAEHYDGAWDSFTLKPEQTLTKDYSLQYWNELPPPEVEPLQTKKQ